MSNYNFPIIHYSPTNNSKENGIYHGESFRSEIKELYEIRKELMLSKNPKLKNSLDQLAREQAITTKDFDQDLWEELVGISLGSNLTVEQIILLNNYTDFRDIALYEQGCSTVSVKTNNNHIIAGQTWDMHESAKKYLCLIKHNDSLILSLFGCLGLMGIRANKILIGVNNINTKNAKAALVWPNLIRACLKSDNREEMAKILKAAPVTSGHNYFIACPTGADHYEVSPNLIEKVAGHDSKFQSERYSFHTNHCLGKKHREIEQLNTQNSTTHIRYELIKEKIADINSFEDLIGLLKNHDNYPKSICSHFQSSLQDPSATCGGGVIDFNGNKTHLWRGCKTYDENYRDYNFIFNGKEYDLV